MTNKNLVWFGVLVVAVIGIWTYSQAVGNEVNSCVNNKTGAVRILNFLSGQCSKTETSLTWNIQGPKGDKGDKGDPGAPGASGTGLHLYDANNQDLGTLIGVSSSLSKFETYIPTLNGLLSFSQSSVVNWSSFQVESFNETSTIFFENSDCTGNSYVNIETSNAENVLPGVIERISNTNRFFRITNEFPITKQTQSNISSGACRNSVTTGGLVRAEEVTLPFSWPPAGPLHVGS